MSSIKRPALAVLAACAAALASSALPASAQWTGHMGPGYMGPGNANPAVNAARVRGGAMWAFGNEHGFGMMGGGYGFGGVDGGMMEALMGGGLFGGLDGGLGLTPEQRTQVAALLQDFRRDRWDAMGEIMDEAANLQLLLAAPVPDAAAIAASRDRLAQLRAHQLEAQLTLRSQIEALLTPEQRERLQALRGCR